MYFDSHCHLDFEAYEGRRAELWSELQEHEIHGLIIPGVSPAQWPTLPSICADLKATASDASDRPSVHYAVGLHPWWIDDTMRVEDIIDELRLAARGAVAIGETGLDQTRHAEHVALDRQRDFLKAHLDLANELELPIILHCIGAHNAMLETLKFRRPVAGGIVHSFSGSWEVAQRYLALGLHLSFSCSALRFGKTKCKAIERIPEDRLLIETDAPDQSASRNRPGSPLDIIEVANMVAEVRGVDAESIAHITSANARALFRPEA